MCPGCVSRHTGSICCYRICLDTAVELWEWKMSARVHSQLCSNRKQFREQGLSNLRPALGHLQTEPAGCVQHCGAALGLHGEDAPRAL